MRKLFGILILTLVTGNCYSQTFTDSLIRVLKKKNVAETEAFLNSAKHVGARPVLYRQILDNYFEYSFEARENPEDKICFFSNGDKIIYAKLLSSNKKKFEEQDSAAVKLFSKNYSAFFGTPVKMSAFFVDDVRYGRGCGFAGVDPPERKKLKTLIDNKDTKTLLLWLRSPVTEKQLYAVEGFTELEKKGYKIAPSTQKAIDFIKTKKGTTKVCNGCIYSDVEISTIFSKK